MLYLNIVRYHWTLLILQEDPFVYSSSEIIEARIQEIEARRSLFTVKSWWRRFLCSLCNLTRPHEFRSAISKVLASNDLYEAFNWSEECLDILNRENWQAHNADPLGRLITLMLEEYELDSADQLSRLYLRLLDNPRQEYPN